MLTSLLSDSEPPCACGDSLIFEYPRHNLHEVSGRMEPRRVRVTTVRDLVLSPLDPLTTELQPLLRRGRWLVTGVDLDLNEERSFYFDSMTGLRIQESAIS